MSYGWYNIRSSYNNIKIKWKKKTESGWLTLTDGMYDYQSINRYLQNHIKP